MSGPCNFCPAPGLFSCGCSESMQFCQNHLGVHVSDTSKSHTIIKIFQEVNGERKASVLLATSSLKQQLMQDKERVLRFGRDLISEIEDLVSDKLSKLSDIIGQIHAIERQVKQSSIVVGQSPLASYILGNTSDMPYSLHLSHISVYERLTKSLRISTSETPKTPDNRTSSRDTPSTPASKDLDSSWRQSINYDNYPSAYNERTSIYEGKPSNDLVCRSGHPLKWSNFTVFHSYKKNNSIWINCNRCNKRFSRSCWTCQNCQFYVCEDCGGKKAPKLVCRNSHELEWQADVSLYYEREHGSAMITCNNCRQAFKNTPSWHCRKCTYDLCENCASNSGYIRPSMKVGDKQGNELKLINDPAFIALATSLIPIICNECRSLIKGEHYKSVNSDYICCTSCAKPHLPCHPGIRCFNNHLLKWVFASSFTCDSCGRQKGESRFRCGSCDFDMCSSCVQSFLRAVKNDNGLKCPRGHFLDWDPRATAKNMGQPWTCKMGCGKRLRSGAFTCNYCHIEACIQCVPKT